MNKSVLMHVLPCLRNLFLLSLLLPFRSRPAVPLFPIRLDVMVHSVPLPHDSGAGDNAAAGSIPSSIKKLHRCEPQYRLPIMLWFRQAINEPLIFFQPTQSLSGINWPPFSQICICSDLSEPQQVAPNKQAQYPFSDCFLSTMDDFLS